MLKKGDCAVFAVILILIAVFGWYKWDASQSGGSRIATVSQYGKVVKTINLDTVKTAEDIKLPGKYDVVIRIERGRICFIHSVTPQQIGVKTGWLSKPGDFAACVPAQAYIKISGISHKLDTVAY